VSRTVEVRIAVVVDASGLWSCAGIYNDGDEGECWENAGEDPGDARYIVVATLAVPETRPDPIIIRVDEVSDG